MFHEPLTFYSLFLFFLFFPLATAATLPAGVFLGEVTAEETYDRLFTVTSRVSLAVTKEDDGVPVDCIIDHPAAKDLLAQRHLRVLCEWPPDGLFHTENCPSRECRGSQRCAAAPTLFNNQLVLSGC